MKKIITLLLVLALCLGLTACKFDVAPSNRDKEMEEAVENERLTNIICDGVWVSADHRTTDTESFGFYTVYDTLTFRKDGTCVYTGKTYKDGTLNAEDTFEKSWKIEGGRVAVFPKGVDATANTVYYDYADGVLLGSAPYCDHPFTYTRQ